MCASVTPSFPQPKGTPISTSTRSVRGLLLASTLALAALSLTGCSALEGVIGDVFPEQAERDDNGEISDPGEADVFSIKVGDCFDDQSGTQFESVPAVPCTGPHDMEAFFSYDLEEGDFPGDDAVSKLADTKCGTEFEKFAGISFDDSASLNYNFLIPTSGSWDGGDREVLCVIYDEDEAGTMKPTTGTLKGAKR